ncbi:MAG TPA: ABC transporter permease [Gemmatimonadaceae bacterium]|nr:ABC transporter permease [Gemmatimonadaceae bacterium]
MDWLLRDLKFGVRSHARHATFTLIVVATIALGVGANAAIFSVVSGILLRPLPYPNAGQLFSFGHEPPQWLTSEPDFLDYRREMQSLEGLSAYTQNEVTLAHGDTPERVHVVRASEGFFHLLGVSAALGRTFQADEHAPRPAQVAVLSNALWRRSFGADPSIVGRSVRIDGIARVVVGVMPAQFDYPAATTDLWMPLPNFNPDSLGDRSNHYLFMVGRLEPGVTLERARVEAATVARRIMRDNPQNFDPARPLVPHLSLVSDDVVGTTRPYLLALLGAVTFVLMIACANVVNLLLVRGEGRHKELALRSAIGASRSRLTWQLLAESSLLAVGGAALGLGLAWAGGRGLRALAPASIPRLDAIGIDWRVVAFTAFVAGLTALVTGVLPAVRASRVRAGDVLRDAGRVLGAHGGTGSVRRALVVAEVALAVVAVGGAGMLLRSLWNLEGRQLGFEPHDVLTATVSISRTDYTDAHATVFFDQLVTRVRALRGVRAVGAVGWLPVVDAGGLWGYRVEGGDYTSAQWPDAVPQQITPGALPALGIPLVAGRDITVADGPAAPLVAVVSRTFADANWPAQNPLGKRFRLGGDSPFMSVVGVAGDLRSRGFDDVPEPTMYFPLAQSGISAYGEPRQMNLVIRVDRDPAAFAAPLRSIVHALDQSAPVSSVRTLDDVVGTSVSNRRFTTALLAGFAVLALALAGIGTYGVVSYGVEQRGFEIGVRKALGAADRAVLVLIMSEATRVSLIGIALGLVAMAGVGRAIRSLLVDVPAVDPVSLALTALLLAVVASAAAMVPARRALRVSAAEALKA